MSVNKSINSIRKLFLDFFIKNGHTPLPSSSLIPKNDPSLMFTNSGMVQFKQIFTSNEEKNHVKTAVTSQKCLRVGGKHNDLEHVGHTNRHHTFFEMLGNFSFGSYFKEEAIEFAWKFMTQELLLNKDRLYITVFHNDNDSYNLWKKISGFNDNKIIKIFTNDNFWSMGDTGPCGPCSEIFYDYGENFFGGLPGTKHADGERFTEIWNLVFMQYNKTEDEKLHKLPKQCIDTGMGLERVTAVIEGTQDNYNIDLFKSLIKESQEKSGNSNNKLAHRVIADHVRAAAFLISEGITPSNEGRDYILRRIIRRASRYAYQLGCNNALLHKIFPVLIDSKNPAYMGEVYSELITTKDLIVTTLQSEEENFRETLSRGLILLNKEISNLSSGDVLHGNIAFKLYDTYGFPLDITLDIIKEKKIPFDKKGFDAQMQKQQERSRKNWIGSGEQSLNNLWNDLLNTYGKTKFVGYSESKSKSKVLAIISQNKDIINYADATNNEISVILDITPFYAESGGQEGDIGTLESDNSFIEVISTKKVLNSIHLHKCTIKTGKLFVGDIVNSKINNENRNCLRANHSATHLLHHVLRNIIGKHVMQKGSLVTADKLRFDFSATKQIDKNQLSMIEDKVNIMIRENSQIKTIISSTDKAIKEGAIALFGEKYDDQVRVVKIGESKELCGGTHVSYSGEIGIFKIVSESSIAFGVRRIEAITGQKALNYIREIENRLQEISLHLKVTPDQILNRLERFNIEQQELKSKITNLYYEIIRLEKINHTTVSRINFYHHTFRQIPADILRKFSLEQCKNNQNSIVVFSTILGDKILFIISISKELTNKVTAPEIVSIIEKNTGGKGGGNLELAQISCECNNHNKSKIPDIMSKIHNLLDNISNK